MSPSAFRESVMEHCDMGTHIKRR
ncbi:hypothetical protein DSM3645_03023 [Blastopirellula marina DSM 3645]|uniref:Uncharacterized protein n=1 Tax=Blastopirellula marina DSM 3645 TaxID=314230 RepID=A3ZVR8_9BACT|nr:hypothetical protein DSM3645_03023 [Blastopirellula marina DSM 3645]